MINLKVTQLYRWKSYYEESNLFANVPWMYINLFFLSPYYASLAASPLGNSVITAIFHYSSNSAAHGGRWSLCGMFKHHSVLSWTGRTKQEKMWHIFGTWTYWFDFVGERRLLLSQDLTFGMVSFPSLEIWVTSQRQVNSWEWINNLCLVIYCLQRFS